MMNLSKKVTDTGLAAVLFISILTFALGVITAGEAAAQPSTCVLNIGKNAEPDTDLIFTFTADNLNGPIDFEIPDGGGTSVLFDRSLATTFTEQVPDGWVLGGVECTNVENFTISDIENGILVACNVPGSEGLCIFNNFSAARPIPTLSEWGMIAAAAGLAMVGVFFAVRRKKARAV
jgi:hypothetical protein